MMKYVNDILDEHSQEKDFKRIRTVFDKLADGESSKVEGAKTLT